MPVPTNTHDAIPPLMSAALAQAWYSLNQTSPNPRVGCIITSTAGQVLGQGYTQQAGGPHAEIMALRDAATAGHEVRGATAYVTLEPCAHQGRTGSCCDALIAAGIAQVVASLEDPNPLVAGKGFARLRAAGVQVEVGPGAAESRELNIGFFKRMERGTPWVRLKVAASLDGTTALHNGASQWITSAAARADGQAWRARACAILTGSGTVLADNPRLDVREWATPRQPQLVVVDSQLQTPPTARLFTANRAVIIYTVDTQNTQDSQDTAFIARKTALQARGATVVSLPAVDGKVALAQMLHDLGRRGINELHVEAGQRLNGALLRAGLVDEWLVYLAPQLLGSGQGMSSFGPLETLAQGQALEFYQIDRIGVDLRILARQLG